YCLNEGVEVYHYHIDRLNLVLSQLIQMFGQIALGQDAPVDCRVI
ncbi:unnamed protein product, partial [marine sediment metagenome]